MKKTINLLLSVLLAATVFTALPLSANAAEADSLSVGSTVAQGTTGDCAWELDSWGTLTVSGSGATADLQLKQSAVGCVCRRYSEHPGFKQRYGAGQVCICESEQCRLRFSCGFRYLYRTKRV